MLKLQNHHSYKSRSKILLKILLNQLNPQAEKIISEEQAGFRKGTKGF